MLNVALDKITPLTGRCFGTGASTNIEDRMVAHNTNKRYDYVPKKDFHKYALFKSGDKIVTKEEFFVLKPSDVLKFEAYAHAVLRLTPKYQN
ncbi:hypothetical protein PVAND_006986 [Polypedilum vanderplanki]|uniref:Uncharacterized protein n=1 Tax=Polypedilum vanderplanki TaxID=319348 RepID=A0A9J6C5U9_POLVA|nr:hypothetical protein PVAND_006986 [Polypedilum vanderplanki]